MAKKLRVTWTEDEPMSGTAQYWVTSGPNFRVGPFASRGKAQSYINEVATAQLITHVPPLGFDIEAPVDYDVAECEEMPEQGCDKLEPPDPEVGPGKRYWVKPNLTGGMIDQLIELAGADQTQPMPPEAPSDYVYWVTGPNVLSVYFTKFDDAKNHLSLLIASSTLGMEELNRFFIRCGSVADHRDMVRRTMRPGPQVPMVGWSAPLKATFTIDNYVWPMAVRSFKDIRLVLEQLSARRGSVVCSDDYVRGVEAMHNWLFSTQAKSPAKS